MPERRFRTIGIVLALTAAVAVAACQDRVPRHREPQAIVPQFATDPGGQKRLGAGVISAAASKFGETAELLSLNAAADRVGCGWLHLPSTGLVSFSASIDEAGRPAVNFSEDHPITLLNGQVIDPDYSESISRFCSAINLPLPPRPDGLGAHTP